MLGISPRTIQRKMAEKNVSGTEYSDLTEEELDDYVKEVKRQFPSAGYRQILGVLESQGIIVREHDLRESAQRCDPIGTSLLWFATVERRRYNVSIPVALWHLTNENDELTSRELKKLLRDERQVTISSSTIRNARRKLGWKHEKARYCQLFTDETSVEIQQYTRYCFGNNGSVPKRKGRPKDPLKVSILSN